MINFLKRIFYPPLYEDDPEKTKTASLLNALLWAITILVGTLTVIRIGSGGSIISQDGIVILVLFIISVTLLVTMRLGFIKFSSFMLAFLSWAVLIYRARMSSGIHDTAYLATLVSILLAGLLLNYRYSIFLAALTIAGGWWMAIQESSGALIPEYDPPIPMMQEISVIFTLIIVLSYLTVRGLQGAIKQGKKDAEALIKTNVELRALQSELEQRVNDRTAELERVSLEMVRRAEQLANIAEIAKVVASVRDINAVFKTVTQAITEQFGFYHTGIFLIEDDYAVLKAASSEGGQNMLRRGHKLKVGTEGIVGYTAFTGQPRIALDTGADAVFFNNPDLPLTHSEIAVPLRIGNQIIGVLDVQSEKQNAFSEEDISIISTLANQVAVAIENANLFEETNRALKESQAAYRKFVRSGWADLARQTENIGYQIVNGKLEPIAEPVADEHVRSAIQEGKVLKDSQKQVLAIPVKLREEVIGAIKIQPKTKEQQLTEDDINAINAIANRAALALENARLINASQKRAAQEQAVAEIASQISSASRIETILQTAVGELGKRIEGVEVLIKIDSEFTEDEQG